MGRINIRLSADEHSKLAETAKHSDLTASQIVRHGIRKYVEAPWVAKPEQVLNSDQSVLQIRIDDDDLHNFLRVCEANGDTFSSVIRHIVKKSIKGKS